MSTPLEPPSEGALPPVQFNVPPLVPTVAPSILTVAAYPAAAAVVTIVTEIASPFAIVLFSDVDELILIFGVAVVVSVVVNKCNIPSSRSIFVLSLNLPEVTFPLNQFTIIKVNTTT